MSSIPQSPPVRHGKCRLTLGIDGTSYRLTRGPAAVKGAKVWRLRALDGPRSGALYSVVSHKQIISCSCPDNTINGAVCKHVRSLQALGLAGRRARPTGAVAAANLAAAPVSGGEC